MKNERQKEGNTQLKDEDKESWPIDTSDGPRGSISMGSSCTLQTSTERKLTNGIITGKVKWVSKWLQLSHSNNCRRKRHQFVTLGEIL